MNVGFRVFLRVPRPSPQVIAKLAGASVPNIADAMHGKGVMSAGIVEIYQPMRRISGVAITVDLTPGDGLMLRKAVAVAQAGDVIVANAHGCKQRAVLGGNVCIDAARKHLSGMIVDGAVRDVEEIQRLDFPVMARGVSPRSGTTDRGWGEVNVPIACGGVVVNPGDILLADRDGIIVVPGDFAVEILENIEAVEKRKGKPEDLAERVALAREAKDEIHGLSMANEAMRAREATIIDGSFEWWGKRASS